MTDTPRTDEKVKIVRLTVGCVELPENHMVSADFARQLERELADALAEVERLKEWEYCMKTQAPYEAAGATWELRHKHDQAVIAERDKLIERMREALIVADSLVTSLIDTHVDKCASVYDFDRDIIKAALSAAEGGEG